MENDFLKRVIILKACSVDSYHLASLQTKLLTTPNSSSMLDVLQKDLPPSKKSAGEIFTRRFYACLLFALALLVASSGAVSAQQRNVSGTVRGEGGTPLIGVTVLVKGTSTATATDVNGGFTLSVPGNNATLVFSYIGYLNQEVAVGSQSNVSVTLLTDAKALEEVVVVGYGTQRREDVSGSIATVDSKDFQKGNVTTPEQLITGKVAGVQITSNGGQPGAGSTIRIRGGASLNASNDPLFVIDGVPLTGYGISGATNPLSLINPNDIESMTILKDASATAIYGSRASNGVVLVTTKKGTSGKPTVNFNTQFIVSEVTKKVDVLNADEFRAYVNANGTDAQKALLGGSTTDWQDEIYQTAIGTDNNLSVSGAFKDMPYRISAGYLNQQGVLRTDKFERKSAAISVTPRFLDDHLKVDINLKGSLTNTRFANQGAIGAAVAFDPTQPVRTENQFGNFYEWVSKDDKGNILLNPNAPRNPVSLLELRNDRSEVQRSFGNAQIDYSFHFLPELHANLNLGYDIAKGQGTVFVPAEAAQSFSVRGVNNQYLQRVNNKVLEGYLNYNKDITSIKSNVNATAGYGYYNNQTKTYNYPSYNAAGEVLEGSNPKFPYDIPENTLISYYGRLIYTLNDKYIFTGTIRTDGSSKFSPDVRWGVFPSASLAWRVSEEAFLKNFSSLSDLKLRVSYGITGQQEGIANYSYQPVYGLGVESAQYQFGGNYYYTYAPVAYDADIKWEQTATTNVGIDYGFFNNRISGSLDIYKKKTKDLLNIISIPVGSNFSNLILTNVGNIENRGIEFAINAVPVQKENLSWSVGVNVTANENEITNLTANNDPNFPGNLTGGISGATGQNIQINSVGYRTYSFYVYKQIYNENGMPLEGVYADLNEDGIINEKDLYRYKAPAPLVTLGFNTQVDYKKWSVSTILRANLGNYMYNNISSNLGVTRNILNPGGFLGNSTTGFYDTNFNNNQYKSDYYIENASFLRMDNLTLGYNAGRVFNRADLRVSLTCQNVFTVTNYSGVDPEISSGIDNNFYLRPRTFVVGLNLGF
ncbi:SusC/RagA family TonB-linked outer membrane protein [Rufibacter quisquiliarum]|uniref:Iron complex outermembrane receptor protein n=1 Tax=Rufibacter quisquiliarum TaxID=1549639 RepID=A0A839GQN9_9BACT|nr:TonB-dependent receptor [Rufibacter quisquiliarum]MBA9077825.1 iron complex outermembrane receptor protein [Rufibacter quisquiliarum]